jgi:hypothetical protein
MDQAQGIRDDVQFHQDLRSREEPNLKDGSGHGRGGYDWWMTVNKYTWWMTG